MFVASRLRKAGAEGQSMGRLYLTTSTERAAEHLAEELAARGVDPFVPQTIVVPNRNVKKWLQLRLARGLGVCANFRLIYLEPALWEQLSDPTEKSAPQLLDEATLSQMILAALLSGRAGQEDELRPLREYVVRDSARGGGAAPHSAVSDPRQDAAPISRAWQLAERLSQLFRDYEFSRPDWLRDWLAESSLASGDPLQQAEKALYRMIFAPGGMRDRLASADGSPMLLTLGELAARGESRAANAPKNEAAASDGALPRLHLFALTQVAPLHVRLLQTIAPRADLQIYCVTPLAARLAGATDARQATADLLTAKRDRDDPLELWGAAAVECLRLLQPLYVDRGNAKAPLTLELIDLPAPATQTPAALPSALAALRRVAQTGTFPDETGRVEEDGSLTILACPSVRREVQTVFNSILDHLRCDPSLRLSDIAVLVTDMSVYRTAITSEFDAPGRRLPFNLTDFSARDASTYAQAMMALLDLPLGRFARIEVCNLLVNPCFLARAGISREEANQWVDYARGLGICHGFDDRQRQELGYPPGELCTWDLGLRRLRLGRVFDCGCGDLDAGEAQAFGDVVPYASAVDQDDASLGLFCELVERLYHRLRRLRTLVAGAADWRDELRAIADQFLAVPDDRPDERPVRDALNDALDDLVLWDRIRAAQPNVPPIGLQFIRQFIGHRLSSLSSTLGTYLTGGVTVSQLKPLRPLPFRICYVLGLGEGIFPGETTRSALNLRQRANSDCGAGIDIETPELNRLLFLETLTSTGAELYLSYVSQDLQRDQELGPSSVITQLIRVTARVREGNAIAVTKVPLLGSDVRYLPGPSDKVKTPHSLVNYSRVDRLLCLLNPANGFLKRPESAQFTDAVAEAEQTVREDFSPAAARPPDAAAINQVVESQQLKAFLRNPVAAVLQRQLQLKDDQEPAAVDDEPFFSVFPVDWQCKDALVGRFVLRAAQNSSEEALAALEDDLNARIAIARKTGQMPDGSFGRVDRQRLLSTVRQVIGEVADERSLAHFVDSQRQLNEGAGGRRFWTRVVVGQSRSAALPIAQVAGDRTLRLLPLKLQVGAGQITLHGAARFVWIGPDSVQALAVDWSTQKKQISHYILEPFVALLMAAASGDARFAGKQLILQAASKDGVKAWDLGRIDAKAATKYLAALCGDYLSASRLDELPMELAAESLLKDEAFTSESFRDEIADQIEAAAEGERSPYHRMDLLEVIKADVPGDALELTRQRFAHFLAAGSLPQRKKKGGEKS